MQAQLHKICSNIGWLPAYIWQRATRNWMMPTSPLHLIIAIADHFEPSMTHEFRYADLREQERRLIAWCRDYPRMAGPWVDSDGCCLRHTYFYPAEQYNGDLVELLAEHCREGWGEIEIHLHHGVDERDTAENTERVLLEFRDYLAAHGCLARLDGEERPRYAFVHGNWALANSAGGQFCGVDKEMEILAQTGCYADFTLPSAPHPAQVAKINSLYECALPLHEPIPHRRGRHLIVGRRPEVFPLIVQGPLMLDFSRVSREAYFPHIENSEITAKNPPTMDRLQLWKRAAITVAGRPDWLFIKLHCHGLDPREQAAMTGASISNFLRHLLMSAKNRNYQVHFVTAREMVNIILAACEGYNGDPGQYRNHRLKAIRSGMKTHRNHSVGSSPTRQEP
ncbi:MAG: hypothetical protein DMG31_14990 [Acidobacteria bacterium]|nr:MAG: hypothetical protein DMG31_14990 [Acidobacteriota bacterium]